MKVLIVSPNEADTRWVRNVLLEQVIEEVETCVNTSDALEILANDRFDLLMVEAFLPTLNGYDLKKLMDSFGFNIPVSFFSEKLSSSNIKEAKYAGVNYAFQLDELEQKLPTLIQEISIQA